MQDYNNVTLTGNLTRDPELNYTMSGTAKCSFSVATNRYSGKDDNGNIKESVSFVSIEVWGKRAEGLAAHLSKGSRVLIAGDLRSSSWENEDDGTKHSRTFVTASTVQFLDSKERAESRRSDNERDDLAQEIRKSKPLSDSARVTPTTTRARVPRKRK